MGLNTPSGGGGAPTDAAYITGSSNSELSNETVVSPAGDILTSGSFGTSSPLSPGFGTFTQVSADKPSILLCRTSAFTDGNTAGDIRLKVDESGGTTPDYIGHRVLASKNLPSTTVISEVNTILLPAGAQFVIDNFLDPTGDNAINLVRAAVITP